MADAVKGCASWITAGLLALVVSVPIYFILIDRHPPFTRIAGTVLPENPTPGSWIEVHWIVVGDRICPGWVFREVVDSHNTIWSLEPTRASFGLALRDKANLLRRFQLPEKIATGRAIYRVRVTYQCNPFHRWWPIVTYGPDLPFMIAPL